MWLTKYMFTVPGETKPKQRWRYNRKTGTSYTPKETRQFQSLVAMYADQVVTEILEGPLAVEIVAAFVPPKSWSKKKKTAALEGKVLHTKRPDCDNLAKSVTDAMRYIVYQDDAQIVELQVRKIYDSKAYTRVVIKEFSHD